MSQSSTRKDIRTPFHTSFWLVRLLEMSQALAAAWNQCASSARRERLRENLETLESSEPNDFVARIAAEGPRYMISIRN